MFELPLNEGYRGVQYAISQTSQVWLDHKAYENDEGFVAEWDYVEQLFDENHQGHARGLLFSDSMGGRTRLGNIPAA